MSEILFEIIDPPQWVAELKILYKRQLKKITWPYARYATKDTIYFAPIRIRQHCIVKEIRIKDEGGKTLLLLLKRHVLIEQDILTIQGSNRRIEKRLRKIF